MRARHSPGGKARRAALAMWTAMAAWAGAAAPIHAETAAPAPLSAERGVKAAFVYKFLGYVDYPEAPADAGAPYGIGVLDADDIAAELARITAGRTINNHPVTVRVLHAGDAPQGLHLLFIGGARAGNAQSAAIRAAQEAGVLSVTEAPAGLQAGSVINFRLVDDRVRFEVSLEAAEKSRVKVSSRLLSVAYAVQKGGS